MLKTICFFISFLMISSLAAQEIREDQKSKQKPAEITGAEAIIRFQKVIAGDQQRLIQLKSRSRYLEQEIVDLTRLFEKTDSQLELNKEADGTFAQNEKLEQVLSSLDLHLRSRQAILQMITLVQGKIEKQQELVDYITLGQIPMSEDSITIMLSLADTAANSSTTSETQNRKELAALQYLRALEAKLMHSKQNLLLVDQLIHMHQDDLELANLLIEASKDLRQLLENQPKDLAVKQHLLEISRRLKQDSSLLSTLKLSIKTLAIYRSPVVETVSQAEKKVDNARAELEFLQSSIAPYRVTYWLKTNLPSIAIILLAFFAFWILTRWAIKLILNKFIKSRTNAESADRLETLKLASGSIITILVVIITFLVILSLIGVDLTVVLGGAAVLSLAIALGAQVW